MSGGGQLKIATANVTLDQEIKRDRAVVPVGDYVVIKVIDDGCGIPADKLAKIFEPFYTTKPVGEGTGLGLSTAYGIIKQTGGFIFADSEPAQGTTFTIYLPRCEQEPEEEAPAEVAESDLTGDGVVMLVEDEDPVRAFAVRALSMRGYTVLEAASGEEALEILDDLDLQIDVLVSDVVMPGLDGPGMVRVARQSRPDAKVIFVSGYAEGSFRENLDGVGDFMFLAKPYSLTELTAKVKEAMHA
jgi:two-component system cell cycle sensor histidine kinase/response regulator CckA